MVLKALTSKRVDEAAYNLVDIITLLGAPLILQYSNGWQFANNVVSSLKDYWLALKMVNGKPHHSQSQASIKRANLDKMFYKTYKLRNNWKKIIESIHTIQEEEETDDCKSKSLLYKTWMRL